MLSFRNKDKERKNETSEALDNIRIAHKQWKDREKLFQEVSDPDLVDFAIFQLEASRLKYIYLLKKFREEMGTIDSEETIPSPIDHLAQKNM